MGIKYSYLSTESFFIFLNANNRQSAMSSSICLCSHRVYGGSSTHIHFFKKDRGSVSSSSNNPQWYSSPFHKKSQFQRALYVRATAPDSPATRKQVEVLHFGFYLLCVHWNIINLYARLGWSSELFKEFCCSWWFC